MVFTISVFVALALAVLFDAWVVKLFTKDFNDIMEDNSKGGEIVNAINRETDAFDEYIYFAALTSRFSNSYARSKSLGNCVSRISSLCRASIILAS